MINNDTIRLLRECNSGIKMGVSSINDVLGHVKNQDMRTTLLKCRSEHKRLGNETRRMLNNYGDSGKAVNPIIESMSHIKTGFKLTMMPEDSTVADIMTDGCNMGVKSLSKYLNQYGAAQEHVKDIAKKLISLEERLGLDMREYL